MSDRRPSQRSTPAAEAGPAGSAGPAGLPHSGHPRKWWILIAVSLGMFMTLLDVTIVNIAIPAIIDDYDATVTSVSWVINAYSLALAVLFLSMGRVADKFGLKRVFLGGLALFTLFSLLCGLAPSIEWLIVFRVGQGIGGAAMTPISLAILMGVFPPSRHGMAVGLWGALGTAAAAVGPTLGGVLIEYFSWNWVFFVNVPVGLAALALTLAVVPERRPAARAAGVDVPGIAISAAGLFCLILALIQGNDWGWASGTVLGLFAAAGASFLAFVWWESRIDSPMFDFRLLRIRSFTAANTAMMCLGAAMGASMFLLVIFLVNVLGYSELRAALAITPMPLTALVVAPVIGRLADRIGPRTPALIGLAFFTAGLTALAQLGGESTLGDVTWRVVLLGAGMGFSMPTLSAAAMGSLPPQVSGVGSGALNTLRQVGFSIGLAVVVAIFSHTIAQNVRTAASQAIKVVEAQPQIPAPVRQQIVAGLEQAAKADGPGGEGQASLGDPLAGAPQAPAGTPAAAGQAALRARVSAIFRDNVADSFTWPFYAAALAALLALGPTLFIGRRLGEHSGHERGAGGDDRRATDQPGDAHPDPHRPPTS